MNCASISVCRFRKWAVIMKKDGLQRVFEFLNMFSTKGIEFKLEQQAEDELMVSFALVGVRVESVFTVDRMQFSFFRGNEDVILDENVLAELFRNNWDE
jgi:hypothetical protein